MRGRPARPVARARSNYRRRSCSNSSIGPDRKDRACRDNHKVGAKNLHGIIAAMGLLLHSIRSLFTVCLAFAWGAAASASAPNSTSRALPPLPSGGISIFVPGTISDVAVGGDGRYVLLWLKDVEKIAVFDVSTLAVKEYIPVDGSNIAFAASGAKIYVAINDRSIIQVWDIASGQRGLTQMLPDGQEIKELAVSQADASPVAVSMADRHVAFIDSATLALESSKFWMA